MIIKVEETFIFVKFFMMPFSTGTGLERVGVVGPDQDYWRAELQDDGSSGLRWVRGTLIYCWF